jgi:hypothetical protein
MLLVRHGDFNKPVVYGILTVAAAISLSQLEIIVDVATWRGARKEQLGFSQFHD